MSTWRIVLITLAVLIAVCGAQNEQLNLRPIRPDSFSSPSDVREYLNKIRIHYAKSGTRFGKRFSPVVYNGDSHPSAQQDWHSIYDLLENYEAM